MTSNNSELKVNFSETELIYKKHRTQIIEDLGTNPKTGLSTSEAKSRLEEFGFNKLSEEKTTPIWQKLLAQFKDFMIIILIIAAIISGIMGDVTGSVVIIVVVLINALLGVIQEGKAEQAIAALQKIAAPAARVLRDGEQTMIPTEQLVVGDIVLLDAGDIVPADARLLTSSNLKVEEASLTGESVPVEKDAAFSSTEDLGLGDRENMLYSSTSVTYGNGTAIVVGTGEDTEVGTIAKSLQGIVQEDTPLQVSLNHLGRVLGILVIIICIIVFGAGLLQGGNPVKLFMTAVSLAVAAIPEGLPAVVTIVLALGMNRMAKKNAIVKKLLAVETLGSIDTICSDKTGTLTQNEMTVEVIRLGDSEYDVSGSGYAPNGEVQLTSGEDDVNTLRRFMEIAVLCNEADLQEDEGHWSMLGDPTEGALLTMAAKYNVFRKELQEKYSFIGSLPFDSDRKAMSVFYSGLPEGYVSLTKGAPDILLKLCTSELRQGEIVPLTEERRQEILKANSSYAKKALRVLAFAYKIHTNDDFSRPEEDMIFVGLSGMIDPPRPEARDAIEVCHKAGIRVVMITGDYAETALAIAKSLKIAEEGDRVITGEELEAMDDRGLEDLVEEVSVYARVSPEHKVRILQALKAKGHACSMTGDGVNDAPALKLADIGVSMGITGTEVAKSSSEMILTDDNFTTIVTAVEEGRIIYSNIRKFVSFLLSCNVGEILVVFITSLLLGPEFAPLIPIQLLWLNLVTDSFPALALGQEKGESDIMDRPPRSKDERIINKPMIGTIIVQAIAIFIAVFAAFQIGRMLYPDNLLADGELVQNGYNELVTVEEFEFFAGDDSTPSHGARTFAFTTLIMAELIRVFSSRSEHHSVFQLGLFSNRKLNRAVLFSLLLMLVVLYVPFMNVLFKTIPPTLRDLAVMFGLALIPFILGELYKGRVTKTQPLS